MLLSGTALSVLYIPRQTEAKGMTSSGSIAAASADMVSDILSWLPPKFVIRFTAACKHCSDIVLDPSFAIVHTSRNPHKIPGFLQPPQAWYYTPILQWAFPWRIILSAYSIFCIHSDENIEILDIHTSVPAFDPS